MLLKSHVNIGHTERTEATTYKLRILRARLSRQPGLRHWNTFWLWVSTGRTRENLREQASHDSTRDCQIQEKTAGEIRCARQEAIGCDQSMKEKRREVAVIDELKTGCLWRPRELKRSRTVCRAIPKPTLKRLLILARLDGFRF